MPGEPRPVVFTGALGDNASGTYSAAQAEVAAGLVTLSVETPAGWHALFTVSATEVLVRSAAQRITLVVRGQSYPILADPRIVANVVRHGIAGTVASVFDRPAYGAGVDLARGLDQVSAAGSWVSGGGPEFLEAARLSGARVARLGYGALAAIGCGAGLAVVVAVTFFTVLALRFVG